MADPPKRSRGIFALFGFLLFLIGVAPFLRVDGPALFFFDSFKEANRPATLLLMTPLAMGFVIFLCSMVARHLWPVLGGMLVLAVVLTTDIVLFKATTPESMRATLEGGGIPQTEESQPEYMTVTNSSGTVTNMPVQTGKSIWRVSIPDGMVAANSLEMGLLQHEEGLLSRLNDMKIKHLFMVQLLGIILMLAVCSPSPRGKGIGTITVNIVALAGATLFLAPMFVPLADESMLFGKVRSPAIALIYVPLVLMAIFCIISNMSGPVMLRVSGVIFWIGLPMAPLFMGVASLRSRALVPFLQYVRLLAPHYIAVILTGFALNRMVRDTADIPERIAGMTKRAVRFLATAIPVMYRIVRIRIRRTMIHHRIRSAQKIGPGAETATISLSEKSDPEKDKDKEPGQEDVSDSPGRGDTVDLIGKLRCGVSSLAAKVKALRHSRRESRAGRNASESSEQTPPPVKELRKQDKPQPEKSKPKPEPSRPVPVNDLKTKPAEKKKPSQQEDAPVLKAKPAEQKAPAGEEDAPVLKARPVGTGEKHEDIPAIKIKARPAPGDDDEDTVVLKAKPK